MRYLSATLLLILPFLVQAQDKIREFEHFGHTNELVEALKKFDLTPFLETDITFVADTTETKLPVAKVNKNLKGAMKLPKTYSVLPASESNHGYTQTFGFYNSEDIAVYFVTLRINPLNKKLEELRLETNR